MELDRLQSQGVIEPVQFVEWIVPLVPILKRNGSLSSICGKSKVTLQMFRISR